MFLRMAMILGDLALEPWGNIEGYFHETRNVQNFGMLHTQNVS